jgi:hypothetical protein
MRENKKLRLSKDTIRNLSEEDLGKVSGGTTSAPGCPRETYIDFGPTICPILHCQEQTADC